MSNQSPIAIVGYGGVFPGAGDLDGFWQNIAEGRDAVSDPPPGRWLLQPNEVLAEGVCCDRVYTARGCFIHALPEVSLPRHGEARWLERLDPMYRLVLAAGAMAWRGVRCQSIAAHRGGVILGSIVLPTDAASALGEELLLPDFEAVLWAGQPHQGKAAAAARALTLQTDPLNRWVSGLPATLLAWSLGFQGPSMTLDAACASSLFAVKLACEALHSGRADVMLAGGVSRPDSLYTQMGFCQLRALSPSGRCAPLDARADGLLVGEGAGIVVLKRLPDALADGDTIHGVIRGIGWSNDLGGNLMAPDVRGQLSAMRAAYQQAGWRPDEVELIECHGTGTPLGDRTELESLAALWNEQDRARRRCVLGSVKGNIGHLLTGAGAAGLIKVLLAWRHETLPPTAHFERALPGSVLAKKGSPLHVLRKRQPWPRRTDGAPRRAAVSAFGFGGTNAHLLMEQWQPDARGPRRAAVRMPKAPESAGACHEETKGRPDGNGVGDVPRVEAPVAIVGLGVCYGPWRDVAAWARHALQMNQSPPTDARDIGAERFESGAPNYCIEALDVAVRRFRIPPQTLEQMLPQQVVMLLAAAEALEEAGLVERGSTRRPANEVRPARENIGVFVGIELDMNTTGYRFRWAMAKRARAWAERLGVELSDDELNRWTAQLRDAAGAPLTAERTMGGLGSIVASRLAKVFRAGGPSFTVSGGEAAGLRALELAAEALRRGEIDVALVGAVDMAGDPRHIEPLKRIVEAREHGHEHEHRHSNSTLAVGEGGAAVVLKRLDDARRDGNHIYAVVRNTATRRGPITAPGTGEAHRDAALDGVDNPLLREVCGTLGLLPDSLGYVEYVSPFGWGTFLPDVPDGDHGGTRAGSAADPGSGSAAKNRWGLPSGGFASGDVAVAWLAEAVGHSGASSGLLALLRAAVCLNDERLPPRAVCRTAHDVGDGDAMPAATARGEGGPMRMASCYWLRNRESGPRRAAVWAEAVDGTQCAVLVEAAEMPSEGEPDPGDRAGTQQKDSRIEPSAPPAPWPMVGPAIESVWLIEGDTPGQIVQRLDTLSQILEHASEGDLYRLALRWNERYPADRRRKLAVAIVAGTIGSLRQRLPAAKAAVTGGRPCRLDGVFYEPQPLGADAAVGYVFPGSGSHYAGMGRDLCLAWPEVVRRHDRENRRLADQFAGGRFWHASEAGGFSPRDVIFGQVCFGTLVYGVLDRLGIRPQAVLGYSLGESASLFATRAWNDRDEMLRRALRSDLFTRQLAGPCLAARRTWRLGDDEAVDWHVAVVAAPAEQVRPLLAHYARAYLLIENTPEQCVVGGQRREVEALIERLGCVAIPVRGVTTVHCEVARQVADAYRALHTFDVTPASNIRVYSAAWGRAYEVTREQAAQSILDQAIGSFDFSRLIRRAYDDGVRLFVELGPGDSCTRMIGQILGERPHLACAACSASRRESTGILHAVAQLAVHRKAVELQPLLERMRRSLAQQRPATLSTNEPHVRLQLGRREFVVPQPCEQVAEAAASNAAQTAAARRTAMAATGSLAPAEALASKTEPIRESSGGDGDIRLRAAAPRAETAPRALTAVSQTAQDATQHATQRAVQQAPRQAVQQSARSGVREALESTAAGVEAEPEVHGARAGDATNADDRLLSPIWAQMVRTADAHAAAHEAFLRLAQQTSQAIRDIAALPNSPAAIATAAAATDTAQGDAAGAMSAAHEASPAVAYAASAEPAAARTAPPQREASETTRPRNATNTGTPVHANSPQQPETARSSGDAPEAAASVRTKVRHTPVRPEMRHEERHEEPRRVVWNRQQCLEFAVGSIAKVFGNAFAEVDRFATRVRLPDEPLMLVDRVTHVEGQPRSMQAGRLVTEHDVRDDWWYLDAGRMVSGVAIEAGQADLMLSAYLGADFQTRGRAVYRLLDAAVTYHRSLPEPGETVVYDIRIRRFFRQGQTHLFRFEFDATIEGRPLMTMRDGCAGFFTPKELSSGQGIVQTPLERRPQPGRIAHDWRPLAPTESQSLDERQVEALRQGRLAEAFGRAFAGLTVQRPLTIPGGRLGLLRRVPQIEPTGGRFGLGRIVAEADVQADDWYLGCHFVDDQVMPGTLMYECALHTLRIFLVRMGWVGSASAGLAFEPVPGVTSRLRCRGQVTAETRRVQYEVAIKELGYDGPQGTPYAIADGLMYADGRPIVAMTDMSLRCSGLTRREVESLWTPAKATGGRPIVRGDVKRSATAPAGAGGHAGTDGGQPHQARATTERQVQPASAPEAPPEQVERPARRTGRVLFDRQSFLEFARGKPSRAFGQRYRPFDEERFIARLPGPPFQFMDRVTQIDGCRAWELAAGGTVCVEYDVPPDAWYFAANRQPRMPLAVLLEVALQPCGWMAAYLGSALRSRDELAFRNLGGRATQLAQVEPETGTLVTTVRMTNVSQSAGMIIENFDIEVRTAAGQAVYRGDTYFGFFTRDALAQQVGIRDAAPYDPGAAERRSAGVLPYANEAPLPQGMLRMVDSIGCYLPDGGPHGLGWIEGVCDVDPDAWFFKAHFFQDPVWPGSLGLESLVELLKVVAHARWGAEHRQTVAAGKVAYEMLAGQTHAWQYRGQVLPTHRKVIVQATVTHRDDTEKVLRADGWLFVDGRAIYRMEGFALRVVDYS